MSEEPAITYDTLLAHVQAFKVPLLDFINKLRPFTLEDEIGHGAAMTVYKSLLRHYPWEVPSKVALKVPNHSIKENSTDEDETITGILSAICQEIRILKHFTSNPFIITLHGITFRDLNPILVVELAKASLSDYLVSRMVVGKQVGWVTKARFCHQVAEGIKALHTVNIVLDDIMAENILLFGSSEEENELTLTCKLSDFGYSSTVASIIDGKETRGTPNFWAPECTPMAPLEMKSYANKSTKNNYAYGLFVWQVAMDGEVPYEDMNIEDIDEAKHSDKHLLKLTSQLLEDTPEVFKKVIIGMTQYEPSEREGLMYFKDLVNNTDSTDFKSNNRPIGAKEAFNINLKMLPRNIERVDLKFFQSMPIPSPIKRRLFRTYEVASLKDDVKAAYLLSLCYGSEFGVKFDKTRMISWATQAAKGGNLEAVKNIVTSYTIDVDQLPENLSQLFPWILQIAENGHKESQLFISTCYKKGICVQKDMVKQKEWDMRYSENDLHPNIMFPEESPLHCAAHEGKIETIKFFIQQEGMDVNARNSSGITPLYLATVNSHAHIITALVEEFGADVNIKDIKGLAPVHIAAAVGNDIILRLLVIKFGAAANIKDSDGITPFHIAAQNGHVETLRFLVNECGSDINVKDNDGWTSLHLAAANGHVDIVKLLVAELGADINSTSCIGRTPLSSATFNGHIDTVKLLVIEFGVDVNVKENDGWTPLHLAVQNGHIDVARFLVAEVKVDVNAKSNDGRTSLYMAAQYGHVDAVKLLVAELGADINTINSIGRTPLSSAASNGHIDIVKLLVIEFGTDVNVKENDGWTPLHLAAQNGHIDIVRLLVVKFGADVNAKSNTGQTPLYSAARNGHVDIAKFLVESKADPNSKTNNGWTPLHIAAENGHISTVRILLAELGADINTRSDRGWTPLHSAAHNGHVNIVKLLVAEFGVDVNIKSNSKSTPLHSAAKYGHVDTVKLLVNELEADINARECEGRTPLICSGGERCKEVALVLSEHPRANIYMKNEDGQNLLHLAVKSRQAIVIKILVEQFHLDIYAKDFKGRTPLDLADDPPIHFDFYCDGCGKEPITGERYKCTVCVNFDFCNVCYSSVNHFNREHIFKIIELPSVKYLLSS